MNIRDSGEGSATDHLEVSELIYTTKLFVITDKTCSAFLIWNFKSSTKFYKGL